MKRIVLHIGTSMVVLNTGEIAIRIQGVWLHFPAPGVTEVDNVKLVLEYEEPNAKA
jgi:hypothetical protein